jgi:hypothetical protein
MEEGGYGQVQKSQDGENWQDFDLADGQATSVSKRSGVSQGNFGKWNAIIDVSFLPSGNSIGISDSYDTKEEAVNAQYRLRPQVGSCEKDEKPDLPTPPSEAFDPIPYTDPVTNCNYNVQLLGFVEEASGGPQDPVYVISGADADPSGDAAARASGGVIGGCNFEPTVYYGGGGGNNKPPFPYIEGDDDDGTPNWLKTLRDLAAGAAAAAVGNLVADAIQDAFAAKYPGLIYRMVSVCEKDAQGEPISEAVEVPIPALKAPDAQLARLDAIVELLQAHKNFKQPICGNEKPELKGDWVTTRWISDEKMDHSGVRLRKLFRYRTQSSRDLGQLSAYWCGFTWKSGPVCVIHKGAWWGTPQIWAESAEEGKRVLRHAAAEAGLDPDQVGGWSVSSSRSPRNGMSGTMKILKKEGYPWIASRQGTNWPNYLASSSDP